MIFARVVQIATVATGFYMSYCRWQAVFLLLDSPCLRAFNWGFLLFLLFCCFYLECADISRNVHSSSSLGRSMETSWRDTASRHLDNVHVYDKWPVWGEFRVDQPTSTCFKRHTSITVYLHRASDRSNSHERRCSTRNLDDMHTICGLYL